MAKSLVAMVLLACVVPALAIYCKVRQLEPDSQLSDADRHACYTCSTQVGYGQRIKENNREVHFWTKTMVRCPRRRR